MAIFERITVSFFNNIDYFNKNKQKKNLDLNYI